MWCTFSGISVILPATDIMKLSYIWSLFAKKDVPAKLYSNPKFEYLVSYETNDYDIIVKYYKIAGDSHILITKDNIPQSVLSSMLQNDEWVEFN